MRRQSLCGQRSLIFLVLFGFLNFVNALPQPPSTDPCEAAPCGKGAECKSMGSIAICVCPNNDKGDPFIACMKEAEEAELQKPNSSSTPNSASMHHQPRSSPTSVTTTKPNGNPMPTTTKKPMMGSSTTPAPPSSTTSTTRSPYVHVYQTTTERAPPSSSFGYSGSSSSTTGNSQGETNNIFPESHRIPIIPHSPTPPYPQHNYPPRPIAGDAASPSYIPPSSSGGAYDPFQEKTMGSSEYRGGSSYPYNRDAPGRHHYSGAQGSYDYDSRPLSYPHHRHHNDRFGQHGYHPTSSGFPAPITEPSSSRYTPTGPLADRGSTYDIYNYNPVRNDIRDDGVYSRVRDPMGKYENCRVVNGIVVCADHQPSYHPYHSHAPPRGDYMTTPSSSYGFHVDQRTRDHYSSYYPDRYTSTSPLYNSYNHRQGYPDDRPYMDTTPRYHHPFHAMEQKVSTQTVISLSPSAPAASSNDPRCQVCGQGAICRLVLDRPVCGCPEGTSGDPSVRCDPLGPSDHRGMRRDTTGECAKHVECRETEVCAKGQCVDPCQHQDQIVLGASSSVRIAGEGHLKTKMCGEHAQCLVVGHTPVCKCDEGYFGNPYVLNRK